MCTGLFEIVFLRGDALCFLEIAVEGGDRVEPAPLRYFRHVDASHAGHLINEVTRLFHTEAVHIVIEGEMLVVVEVDGEVGHVGADGSSHLLQGELRVEVELALRHDFCQLTGNLFLVDGDGACFFVTLNDSLFFLDTFPFASLFECIWFGGVHAFLQHTLCRSGCALCLIRSLRLQPAKRLMPFGINKKEGPKHETEEVVERLA